MVFGISVWVFIFIQVQSNIESTYLHLMMCMTNYKIIFMKYNVQILII